MSENSDHDLGQVLGLILGREKRLLNSIPEQCRVPGTSQVPRGGRQLVGGAVPSLRCALQIMDFKIVGHRLRDPYKYDQGRAKASSLFDIMHPDLVNPDHMSRISPTELDKRFLARLCIYRGPSACRKILQE